MELEAAVVTLRPRTESPGLPRFPEVEEVPMVEVADSCRTTPRLGEQQEVGVVYFSPERVAQTLPVSLLQPQETAREEPDPAVTHMRLATRIQLALVALAFFSL